MNRLGILIPSDLEAAILTALPGEEINFGGFLGRQGPSYLALICGVGEANAAAAVGYLAGRFQIPRLVLLGIAGVYPGSRLRLGEAALASEEIHADLGLAQGGMAALGFPSLRTAEQAYYNDFPASEWALQLGAALSLPMVKFLTRDRVSESEPQAHELAQRYGAEIENMEGAGAALAAIRLGVDFAQIRSVSNPAGQRDRAQWDVAGALSTLQKVLEQVLALE